MERNKNFSVMFVLGPPGSGKGTQIKLLAEKVGFLHLISSQLGKDYIKTHNDEESLMQKKRSEEGLLFDPQWMFKIIKEKTEEILKHSDGCKGIIYDGSPRTLFEVEKLYDFLSAVIGKENIKVIFIDVGEDELKNRIKSRLVFEKRVDDKEEVFEKRMEVFKKETLPVLEFLRKNLQVIDINGDQSVEEVHEEVIKKLRLA